MEKYAKVSEVDIYWNSIKNLGKDVKLALIAKLSNSLLDTAPHDAASKGEGWTEKFRGMTTLVPLTRSLMIFAKAVLLQEQLSLGDEEIFA